MNEPCFRRNIGLDILKGIAILLVVLGHVISWIYDPETFNRNLLFKICYSFHMHLFFFISGMLTGYNDRHDNGWLLRRLKRLGIPCLIWTMVYLVAHRNVGLLTAFFVKPAYWFLSVLLLYDIVTWLREKIKHVGIVEMTVFLLSMGMYAVIGDENEIIKMFALYFPMFWAGLHFHGITKKFFLNKGNSEKIVVAASILYPLSLQLYQYKEFDKYAPMIAGALGIKHFGIIKVMILFYNHCIVAPLGIAAAFVCAKIIVKKFKLGGGCTVEARTDNVANLYTPFSFRQELFFKCFGKQYFVV